jgi:CubicO group peptidase (beta-lactamase class C family)
MVGSTTKAFTAAAMSLLIDDNDRYPELKWDTKISKLIRDDFVLQDDHITNHITIEDTLSHRTGMPRHDMSYGGTLNGRNQTVRDLVRSLRHLPLSAELRSKYQYCNMMYVVAAYVIETVTGSWLGDVIRSRLLEPLDMKSTYFGTEEAYKAPEHFATGYYYGNGSYRKVPDMNLLQASGAGFMVSNALDYTKWIRALIDEAPPISKAGHGALRRPRTLEGGSSAPYTGPQAYALGWENGVYQGHEWFQHSGGMEAYGANVIFFPKLRYGLVAFGNTAITSNYVEMALQWNLVDEKLGVPKKDRFDWNKQ